MEIIGKSELWSFYERNGKANPTKNTRVRKSQAIPVRSFLELAKKIAELQFRNREQVLLFRGQGADYRNQQGNTTLKPRLFRPEEGKNGNPRSEVLIPRFEQLTGAERMLAELCVSQKVMGHEGIQRHRILRWAVLQHYEVCRTPLLDVTQSLRIAASFASHENKKEAFVFVVGVPNLSGAVTASAEAGLQIIRLASVCPPSALRPHLQEGFLLGEYPEMVGYEQKQHYHHYEIDFGRRLVSKFRFNPSEFWGRDTFPQVAKSALYPNKDDPLFDLAQELTSALVPVN